MRKIIITLLAVITVTAVSSAQQKGDKYVGGALGVGTTSLIVGGESATGVSFGIAPEFGYFVADKFKIGGSIAYTVEMGDVATHTFQVMPSIAYYVELCKNLYYTPGVQLGFALGSSDGLTMPGFGVGLSLGSFEFRPTPKFGFEVNLLSFSYVLLTYNDDYMRFNSNAVVFNLGLNPSVGLKYYF
jgi:hypothetical protein